MANDKFDFGFNEQPNLFDTREPVEESSDQLERDGANPILPLQILPKQLRLAPIEHFVARKIWLHQHYLHRDFAGATLELGVYPPDMSILIGAIAFSSRLGGSKKGGKPDTWEIRRMWLSDEHCARNSESRVLRIACRMVKKIAPHVRYIISYSDHTQMGHKGTIYKAAGFSYHGETGKSDWTTNKTHKAADSHSKKRWILWMP